MAIELDNYSGRRQLRIEYKHPDDPIPSGQSLHFRAEVESTKPGWTKYLYLVIDEGQTDGDQLVRWGMRSSETPWSLRRWEAMDCTRIDDLAKIMVRQLWGPSP